MMQSDKQPKFNLQEQTVSAYESSEVGRQDILRIEEAKAALQFLLSWLCGEDVEVTSTIVEVDNVTFTTTSTDVFNSWVTASWTCPNCKEIITSKEMRIPLQDDDETLSKIEGIFGKHQITVGQLLSSHQCKSHSSGRIGFRNRN